VEASFQFSSDHRSHVLCSAHPSPEISEHAPKELFPPSVAYKESALEKTQTAISIAILPSGL